MFDSLWTDQLERAGIWRQQVKSTTVVPVPNNFTEKVRLGNKLLSSSYQPSRVPSGFSRLDRLAVNAIMGDHVPRDGERGLHLCCVGFDSLILHQIQAHVVKLGRRTRLRPERLKSCRFDPYRGHQLKMQVSTRCDASLPS